MPLDGIPVWRQNMGSFEEDLRASLAAYRAIWKIAVSGMPTEARTLLPTARVLPPGQGR